MTVSWQEVLPGFDVLVLPDLCNMLMKICQKAWHSMRRKTVGSMAKDLI
jgi:hypothetical protein